MQGVFSIINQNTPYDRVKHIFIQQKHHKNRRNPPLFCKFYSRIGRFSLIFRHFIHKNAISTTFLPINESYVYKQIFINHKNIYKKSKNLEIFYKLKIFMQKTLQKPQ